MRRLRNGRFWSLKFIIGLSGFFDILIKSLPMTNILAQALSLGTSCSFLHNAAPLDNTVILAGKRVFVKSN